jgi:hypothetical protein
MVKPMSETPETSAPVPTPAEPAVLPAENLLRGTLFSLLIIPAGVLAWGLVAAFGYISWIVGAGIVFGALALYRYGSGGRISFGGAARVSVVMLITLALSFIAGFVTPQWAYFSRAISTGKFFEGLGAVIGRNVENAGFDILAVVVFAVIGVVVAFRTAAQQAKQLPAAQAV